MDDTRTCQRQIDPFSIVQVWQELSWEALLNFLEIQAPAVGFVWRRFYRAVCQHRREVEDCPRRKTERFSYPIGAQYTSTASYCGCARFGFNPKARHTSGAAVIVACDGPLMKPPSPI